MPGSPPVAKRVPHVRTVHGESVTDDYYWLLDRDDPDTIAYLEAENAWTEAATAHLAPLRDRLFEEIKARVQETDLSVPARKGPWWYVSRTLEGAQYPVLCRRRHADDEAGEQVLIDGNALAGDSPYFDLGVAAVSPDHRMLAFSVDLEGDERYHLRFMDLDRGGLLDDEVSPVAAGGTWAGDNATFFYVTLDTANRPHRVWRHRLGTAAADDVVVFDEPDERFFVHVGLTRSEQYLLVTTQSKLTSEVRALPADRPYGSFEVIEPRRQGVEYHVDHQGDRFLVLANDGHEDFALLAAPLDSPGRASWRELWAPGVGTRLDDVEPFADHLVVHFRRDALTGLRVIPTAGGGEAWDIELPEPLYTVAPGSNLEYHTGTFRLGYQSLVTPSSVYDYDLAERRLTLLKRSPVLGGFEPADYEQRREWALAPDGERVPISLVRRVAGIAEEGPRPCLLYGYGSYELSIDPYFSVTRLPLLDRGVVFAIAHVRGGGEGGRRWYENGKLLAKPNTFGDFVAAAEHLCRAGVTAPDRLAARGASAGGLLMGAVANLAPHQFAAIVAEVPFVDALNTILDPGLPLTVTEWEEWGNPIESEDVYRCMRGYSPYENVDATDYPAILATAGLNDPRVLYHEPAKWVAKLRATATGPRPERLVLKTEMGAGHGGLSGRYDAWRDQAFVMAFVIDVLGAPAELV